KKEKAVKTESKIPQEIRRIPDYTSRYNPYITKFDVANSKNKTITWNVFKFGIAIIALVFGIFGLFYAGLWQVTNGKGLLFNFNIFEAGLTPNTFVFAFKFDSALVGMTTGLIDQTLIDALNGIAGSAVSKGLSHFTDFKSVYVTITLVFSVLAVVSTIPLLVFKKGTYLSLTFMILTFSFSAVVIGMFAFGIDCQLGFLKPYYEMSRTYAKLVQSSDAALVTKINDLLKEMLQAFSN
ncbi:MAG: hypothetical protein ACRC4M_03710, partial [Mycoplasma sp.]